MHERMNNLLSQFQPLERILHKSCMLYVVAAMQSSGTQIDHSFAWKITARIGLKGMVSNTKWWRAYDELGRKKRWVLIHSMHLGRTFCRVACMSIVVLHLLNWQQWLISKPWLPLLATWIEELGLCFFSFKSLGFLLFAAVKDWISRLPGLSWAKIVQSWPNLNSFVNLHVTFYLQTPWKKQN